MGAPLPKFFIDSDAKSRGSGSGGEIVAMMQTANPWHRYHPAASMGLARGLATGRRSLCQSKMSAVLVVIANVIIHETFQMLLVQNNHMVEKVAAAVPNPALGDTVLPRASEAGLAGGPGPISNK